jgi:hypothetical protein
MGGFIYKGDYCMKKELIVLSFLVGSFSLWGMDQGLTEQHMLPNPIKIFNDLITDFFDENQNDDDKLNILETIRTNFKKDIGESNDIRAFLETKDNDVKFLKIENAYSLFSIIYFLYSQEKALEFNMFLQNYPGKICSIFEICFSDERYLNQQKSRNFFLIILSKLFNYIKEKPFDILETNNCLTTIVIVSNYIKSIESSEPTEITFNTCKSLMQSVCQLISSPLDEFSTTSLQRTLLNRVESAGYRELSEKQDEKNIAQPQFEATEQDISEEDIAPKINAAFIASALMQQQKANTEIAAAVANKAFEKPELRSQEVEQTPEINETNSESTFWDWIMWIDKAMIDFGVTIRKAFGW